MTLQEKLQGFGRSSVTAELLQGLSHAEAFTTIRVPAWSLRTGHLSRHSLFFAMSTAVWPPISSEELAREEGASQVRFIRHCNSVYPPRAPYLTLSHIGAGAGMASDTAPRNS